MSRITGSGTPGRRVRLEELYVGGGDFDGGGKEAGELDEEAFGVGAAEVEEVAAVAVKGAADDADLAAVHVGGYLVGAVVAYFSGGAADGMDEEGHVGCAHCYGGGFLASCVSVLEGGNVVEGFVKELPGAAYKQEVGDYGALAALRAAGRVAYGPFQGCEHLKAFCFKLLPSHLPGIRTPEIAQSVPLRLFRLLYEKLFSGLHCW